MSYCRDDGKDSDVYVIHEGDILVCFWSLKMHPRETVGDVIEHLLADHATTVALGQDGWRSPAAAALVDRNGQREEQR